MWHRRSVRHQRETAIVESSKSSLDTRQQVFELSFRILTRRRAGLITMKRVAVAKPWAKFPAGDLVALETKMLHSTVLSTGSARIDAFWNEG